VRIDAGGPPEIAPERAAVGEIWPPVPVSMSHELFAGIDDQRSERRRQLVGRHVGIGQRGARPRRTARCG